jgi:hypothetical protein
MTAIPSWNPLAAVLRTGTLLASIPSPPVTTFLTVKNAAIQFNKSPSSIRRIIYPILEDDKHPDRHFIEPTPEEATALRLKAEGFAWRISEELLSREIPPESVAEKASGNVPGRDLGGGTGDLLEMLRQELAIKNQQITQQSDLISKQMELIGGLSERLREGNILMGTLQQQLKLPDSSAKTVDSSDANSKRGVFSRLFSKPR